MTLDPRVLDALGSNPRRAVPPAVNLGPAERAMSFAGGAALAMLGLRRSRLALGLGAIGAALVWRGVTGHCAVYEWMGIDRAARTRGNLGLKLDREAVVRERPEAVFAFWRDFSNLPLVMPNLASVKVLGPTLSHWRLKTPPGMTVEWDAEVINEKPGELIAWRSTPTSSVQHAGSVRFELTAEGGTRVEVSLQYAPPAGELGHVVAELLGADAGKQIDTGLAGLQEAIERARVAVNARPTSPASSSV
jgi:uncharacterized membrane protein